MFLDNLLSLFQKEEYEKNLHYESLPCILNIRPIKKFTRKKNRGEIQDGS
jgi:hypothetical protein